MIPDRPEGRHCYPFVCPALSAIYLLEKLREKYLQMNVFTASGA